MKINLKKTLKVIDKALLVISIIINLVEIVLWIAPMF